jgi:hypothetical protein
MGEIREIDGTSYDAALLKTAEKLSSGRGDGRLSREDAETILEQLTEHDGYTQLERDTVAFIREHFEWTEAAADWFGTELGKWSADQSRH